MEGSAFPLDLRQVLVHGWKLVLPIVIVFLALGFALHSFWPTRYEATAVLTVAPSSVSFSGSGSVNMDTERVVAASDSVLNGAAETLGGPAVAQLRSGLEISVPQGSNVLEFTVSSTDPEQAAGRANAIAESYASQRTRTAENAVDTATENLSLRIAELEEELGLAEVDSVESRAVELQIQSLQERQATLSAATFYPGTIVSVAVPPSASETPSLLVFLGGALFLGLVLGSFAALLRERARALRMEEPDQDTDDPLRKRRDR